MNIIAILGLAVIAVLTCTILKKHLPEYAVCISLLVAVIFLLFITGNISSIVCKIKDIVSTSAVPYEYCVILFKSLGICLLTQFVSNVCIDAGEKAMSCTVELVGKLFIITLTIPLFDKIMNIIIDLTKG